MIDLKRNSLYLGSAAPTSGGGGGGGGSSFKMPLFTSHFYDINPNTANDNSWVESDGEWISGTDYPDAYAMLVSEYDNPGSTIMGSMDSSKYIAGSSISFDESIATFTINDASTCYIRPASNLRDSIKTAINNASSFEYEIKVSFGNFHGSGYTEPLIFPDGANKGLRLEYYHGSNTVTAYFSNKAEQTSSYRYSLSGTIPALTTNTFYYFRFTFDGTNLYLKYSSDGVNFTIIDQKPIESGDYGKPFIHNGIVDFGRDWIDNTHIALAEGSKIDFSRTSIKADGNVIWSAFTETGKKTPRNFIITTDDNMASTKFTSDGISWYYVLDKANTRFKLPRTTYNFVGTRGNTGSDVDVFEATSSTPAPSTEMGLYFYLGQKAVNEE